MIIKRKLSERVFNRDGGRCVKCGSTENLSIDHIKPIAEGGTSHMANLQTLCVKCNKEKGFYQEFTFWQKLRQIWRIPDIIAALKNYVKSLHSITQGVVQKNKEEINQKVDANYKALNERFDNLKKYIAQMENEKAEDRRKIEEFEKKLRAFASYMKVEYDDVPRFKKIKKPRQPYENITDFAKKRGIATEAPIGDEVK